VRWTFQFLLLFVLTTASFPVHASVRGRMFIWLEGEIYLLKVVYLGDGARSLDGLGSAQVFRGDQGWSPDDLDRQSDRGIEIYVAALRKHYLHWANARGLYKAGADPEFAQVAWRSWMQSTHFLVLEKHDPSKEIPSLPSGVADIHWRIPATVANEWGFAGEPVAAFAVQAVPHDGLTDFERYFGIRLDRDLPKPAPATVVPNLFWVPHTYPEDRYFGGSIWVHGLFIKKEKVSQFLFQSMLRAAVGLGVFSHSSLVPKGQIIETTEGPVEGPLSVMPSRIYSFCWDPRTSALHQVHGFKPIPGLVGRKPPTVDYLDFLQVNTQDLAIETVFLGQQTAQSLQRDIFYIDRLIQNRRMNEISWSLEHPLETVAALQELIRLPEAEFSKRSEYAAERAATVPAPWAELERWLYSTAASARQTPSDPLHSISPEVHKLLPGSVVVPAESCSQELLRKKSLWGFRLTPHGGEYKPE
jgi:hypothetical protein